MTFHYLDHRSKSLYATREGAPRPEKPTKSAKFLRPCPIFAAGLGETNTLFYLELA
jgi:hypothetical protein